MASIGLLDNLLHRLIERERDGDREVESISS